MFDAVVSATGAVFCTAAGSWLIRRRRGGARAGWGVVVIGAGQVLRAAGSVAGGRQPLGFVLAMGFAMVTTIGFGLLAAGMRMRRGSPARERQLRVGRVRSMSASSTLST